MSADKAHPSAAKEPKETRISMEKSLSTKPQPALRIKETTDTSSKNSDCTSIEPDNLLKAKIVFADEDSEEGYAADLWQVTAPKAKIRIGESRRSRRVCELLAGARVRCVERAEGSQQFRIDLPLHGWASFSNRHDQVIFRRVEPSCLLCIQDRFWLELELGRGSFGCVYAGWDKVDKRRVAMKIDKPKGDKRSSFQREIEILKKLSKVKSVPKMWFYGVCDKEPFLGCAFMVMDLQGLSLSVIKKNYINVFSLKTVLMLGIEAVKILNDVHDCGIVHRDIKPANFVVDRKDGGRGIHLLDFGLSVSYRKSNGEHVDDRSGGRCGTARYSSLNCHRRKRQSRRDDLEALGYVLLLFIRDLPWKQHKGEKPEHKWQRIFDEKMAWPIETLCENLPGAFVKYFKHVRCLKFKERPNYQHLIQLFKSAMHDYCYVLDYVYDWTPLFSLKRTRKNSQPKDPVE